MDMLSDTFRARRIAMRMTQEHAAVSAGLAKRTLAAFESGEGRISLANLRRLMAVVGLELTTREASRRPTLDELSECYGDDELQPLRKRASKQSKKSA
jgi:transcriptional regulator with XRE-family HTH domain